MQSKTMTALITLLATANTAGCYSTWDIQPSSLKNLDGFLAVQPFVMPNAPADVRYLKTVDGDAVEFTRSTSLRFHGTDDIEAAFQFKSARIEGNLLVGDVYESPEPVQIDLMQIDSVRAKKFSPVKTIALTTGMVVLMGGMGGFMLFLQNIGNSGRPLRIPGQTSARSAALTFGRAIRTRRALSDRATRRHLFAHWAKEASAEGASIPAFLMLARDLRRASAPTNLVQAALQAAREEAVHTRMCAARAAEHAAVEVSAEIPMVFDGADENPQSLLERLVLEAFWDGCLEEGAAAALARRNAQQAGDAETRLALQTIARDEQGHAELAERVMAFGLSVDKTAMRRALRESFEQRQADEEMKLAGGDDAATHGVDEDAARRFGMANKKEIRAARVEAWEKGSALLARL